MTKAFLLVGSLILLMTLVLACGGAAEPTAVPPTEAPTAAPTSTTAPVAPTATEAATEEDTSITDVDPALRAAALERAGGPGSFYLGDGDFSLLVGPAPAEGLGDADDMVNLAGLQREGYLFDSQYYQNLVEKANFTNPTEMTYDGDPIEIQFACINRTVAPCELWTSSSCRSRPAPTARCWYPSRRSQSWASPGRTPWSR